jgi:phage FluMu gp28-like protein
MGEPRLTTPRYRVVMDDGAEHEVRVVNADMVWFDRERARRKDWPAPDEGPLFWQTCLAWRALRRTEVLPDMTLRVFEDRCLQVEGLDEAEEAGDEVDPTRPDPEPE